MQIDLIGDTIFLATDSGVEKIWNNGHSVLEVNNGGIQNSVLSFILTDELSFINVSDTTMMFSDIMDESKMFSKDFKKKKG